MAGLPKRPCRHQGCVEYALDRRRFCAAHQREHENKRKRESRARNGRGWTRLYDDPRWKDRKAAFLRRNPLCAECGRFGVVRGAEVVDHVVPHRGDLALFWDEGNWQPLCARCHNEKTAREDGGFGNRRSAQSCAEQLTPPLKEERPERGPLRL